MWAAPYTTPTSTFSNDRWRWIASRQLTSLTSLSRTRNLSRRFAAVLECDTRLSAPTIQVKGSANALDNDGLARVEPSSNFIVEGRRPQVNHGEQDEA